MEEGKIIDEGSPIMGEITTMEAMKNDNYSSSTTKPLDFARILTSLLVFSTLGIAFLVLYYSSNEKNGQFVPSLGRLSSSFYGDNNGTVKDEYYELRKVLEAASTKEKTVILTTLNDAWAEPNSIFDLFLESFRIGNNIAYLLNHLVVIAVDEKAYFRCHELGFHCYYLKTNKSSLMAHEARFMTPIYLDMMWGRLAFLRTILSLGYNFVFTDTDVMWFRDPLPHFTPYSDFQTSCDHFNGDEFDLNNAPNNGFVFVRSNNRTIKFYDFWVSSRHTYPRLHEQDVFNKIKSGDFVRQLGLKLRFMDTTYFGGFCERSRDFNKVCTMHSNCCIGLDNKIADLNTILKVWKNYLSNNHMTLQPSNWRVPHKCHM
ncbi:uncharacterized protein At4g15970-like [Chenopodium quinoa]|uniref:uncharacterized protein At4g15970-like n=1 Tax=Chenopodium quinoa TaxID=63459 RepID=UPI000B78F240|nr:uncharacterized protein At4g15970-like [Chenopodium quinoa]